MNSNLLTFENIFAGVLIISITVLMLNAMINLELSSMFTTKSDPERISHTRFWSNVAYFVATITFIKLNFTENNYIVELWLIYLGVIGGNASISKLISMKYDNKPSDKYNE